MKTTVETKGRIYYGPDYQDVEFVSSGSAGSATGSAETGIISGYVDSIVFDNGASSASFTITITRSTGEVVYTKTGLTGGAVVRPRTLECKSEDGAALATRCRIWLLGERLTVAVSSADPDVTFTATIITTQS